MGSCAKDYIGKVFDTSGGTKCKVIDVANSNRVTVKFIDDFGYEVVTRIADLKKGYVKNPYAPSVCGVGYLGGGKFSPSKDSVKTLAYVQWHGFIRRSYDLKYKNKEKSYEKVSVCDEWHCFDTFAEWFYNQVGCDKGFHIDKDLFGNKSYLYSPENCCLIPSEINIFLSSISSVKGNSKVGVYYNKKDKRFHSTICKGGDRVFLGSFKDESEAFQVYKVAKESEAKRLAVLWKGFVEDSVFEALYNLEVYETGWLIKDDSSFKFYEDGRVVIPKYFEHNHHLNFEGV